jgi:hypothetical protein
LKRRLRILYHFAIVLALQELFESGVEMQRLAIMSHVGLEKCTIPDLA